MGRLEQLQLLLLRPSDYDNHDGDADGNADHNGFTMMKVFGRLAGAHV